MYLSITAEQLRAALEEIEAAEANGFNHCLAVFRLSAAGPLIKDNLLEYDGLWERAHPTDGRLDWGRCQLVSRNNRFDGERLVPLES